MKPVLLCLLLLFSAPAIRAQNEERFNELDEYAKKAPKEYEKSLKELTAYLITPAKTDMEKARVLYTWVATHLRYNASAYNSGKIPDQSTETIFKTRRSVCEGYSNLLQDMCQLAGLEAVKIIGYSKGYSYKKGKKFKDSDHAWNAIKVDGQWKLMDVTWGSGYAKNVDGKMKAVSKFDPYWFDVHPKKFIFTHLPEEQQWQLIDQPITLSAYEKMPRLGDDFFKLGFDPDKVYHDASEGAVTDFAEAYTIDESVKAIQLPYTETISKSEATEFILQSDDAAALVLVDGKNWIPFEQEGTTFTLSHQPKHKKISIGVKKSRNGNSYSTIVKYRTKK